MPDDPYRMYLVVRRGAFGDLETGGVLAGAAAVACLRRFGADPDHADAVAAWRDRPGKVTLRARGGQWNQLLGEEPLELAGDPDGASVAALPPRRRSARSELLTKMQAMSSPLEPAPQEPEPHPVPERVTYVLNPRLEMSSGKTIAQVAHAATGAAADPRLAGWVAAGCPARVVVPTSQKTFDAFCDTPGLAARVVDAGLTEVPPGTVTVLALPPGDTRPYTFEKTQRRPTR
jgi:peptidyl-tRNA hydrolase